MYRNGFYAVPELAELINELTVVEEEVVEEETKKSKYVSVVKGKQWPITDADPFVWIGDEPVELEETNNVLERITAKQIKRA